MTQDDKDLLLRDLCGRLPYGVKVHAKYIDTDTEVKKVGVLSMADNDKVIAFTCDDTNCYNYIAIHEAKPYLFPLSSMTEEQRIEASFEFGSKKYKVNIFGDIESYSEIGADIAYIDLESIGIYIDWLNKNHFDYRGLIKKELAIDATNLGIYK